MTAVQKRIVGLDADMAGFVLRLGLGFRIRLGPGFMVRVIDYVGIVHPPHCCVQ